MITDTNPDLSSFLVAANKRQLIRIFRFLFMYICIRKKDLFHMSLLKITIE